MSGQRDDDVTLEGLSPFALPDEDPAAADLVPPRRPPSGTYRTSAAQREADTRPGGRIGGRYEIEATLGTGGMGVVFRVRHLGLDKPFALKLMHHDISANEETRAQFYREARVASSLVHPNIVSVVDFGEDERLGAFMVMELLEGTKLSTELHERRNGESGFAPKPWCDVMLQLAEASLHIHQHGIVHGDIKPDNVMLCQVPSMDRRKIFVKLLDFGLARPAQPDQPRAGTVSGTPHYMAPERLLGKPPQPSNDVYSLGVVGYELLAGRPPFDGSIPSVIEAHVQRPVPTFASLGVTGVDEAIEALVQRALAKNPAERHRDMSAFLYELRTIMSMLGMGRRRAVTTPRARTGGDQAPAAALFTAAPVPQAGVDVDGRVVVSNRAFTKFVSGDPDAAIAGVSVAATRIVDVFPDIMAELRPVHISAQQCRRVIRLADAHGAPVELVVWMVPGGRSYGDVIVTVYSLPRR